MNMLREKRLEPRSSAPCPREREKLHMSGVRGLQPIIVRSPFALGVILRQKLHRLKSTPNSSLDHTLIGSAHDAQGDVPLPVYVR